ncbi:MULTISPECIES: FliC/FljB family flagellin [Halomonadaceae]|uniref:FliC/FljB family flagellin n=1 Tax=Halomonadaceae TaxID=28256 RepID=UPI001599A6E5|nr:MULTISPECIES: FliC/FljB family flagellin [Halomonas]QJQ94073.1 FliC/FljB family flagellin [Halomonas sp. PA5]
MSVINTNITSMIGQSNLSKSQNALQTSMERLSSGLRINSAKDDAAGQAIANRMTAQITGLNQAQRNANDGISLAQTAEGSLNQVNDNLQRIRELTVQAQNGTNSSDDLKSIQDEIDQRLAEIDRISAETNFNGVNVLASEQGLQIQVGANDGETITVQLKQIDVSTLFADGFSVAGAPAATATDVLDLADADATVTLGEDDVEYTKLADGTWEYDTGEVDGDDEAIMATVTSSELASLIAEEEDDVTVGDYTIAANGTVTDTDSGDAVYVENDALTTDPDAAATENPLAALDAALNQVDSLRSELGAVQNRFEDAITNLNTNSTNLSAARSRIEDADYAVEVANMTRAQILQQAGTSVLAQANQIPQNVLSLLG